MHTLRFCFCYSNSILQNNTYFYERRVVERKKQKAATKKTWASKEIAKEESNRNCKCHFSFDRFYCGLLDHFICWFSFASSCFSFGLLTASEADLQCEFSFWYCSSFVLCKTTRQYIMLFDAIASALLLRLLYIYIYINICVCGCVCALSCIIDVYFLLFTREAYYPHVRPTMNKPCLTTIYYFLVSPKRVNYVVFLNILRFLAPLSLTHASKIEKKRLIKKDFRQNARKNFDKFNLCVLRLMFAICFEIVWIFLRSFWAKIFFDKRTNVQKGSQKFSQFSFMCNAPYVCNIFVFRDNFGDHFCKNLFW